VDHASAIALLVEPGGVEGEILVVTPDEKVLVVLTSSLDSRQTQRILALRRPRYETR
jgi:hypothetical protein